MLQLADLACEGSGTDYPTIELVLRIPDGKESKVRYQATNLIVDKERCAVTLVLQDSDGKAYTVRRALLSNRNESTLPTWIGPLAEEALIKLICYSISQDTATGLLGDLYIDTGNL